MTDATCTRREWRLSALLDDELTDRERAAVGAHLVDCAHCRDELDSLRVTRALLRGAPVRALPQHVAAGMATAVSGPTVSGPAGPATVPPAPRRALTRVAAVAVAVSGLVGMTAFAVGGDGPAGPPRQVAVPLDVYVADHLVRTTGRPVSTPVMLEVGR